MQTFASIHEHCPFHLYQCQCSMISSRRNIFNGKSFLPISHLTIGWYTIQEFVIGDIHYQISMHSIYFSSRIEHSSSKFLLSVVTFETSSYPFALQPFPPCADVDDLCINDDFFISKGRMKYLKTTL